MQNHQVLDNITHKTLQVDIAHNTHLTAASSYARVFVGELRDVQSCYPIMFQKHASTGEFEIIAMFGFAGAENLFLDDAGWHANYIPWSVQREPFLIGFQEHTVDGVLQEEPVVFVDMDSPRVQTQQGEQVFLAQGGQSEYLQHINALLFNIHQGHAQNKAFIDTLLGHDLLESVHVEVELKDASKHSLNSLYTINEEKLAALDNDTVNKLHSAGYWHHIYMCVASVGNLSRLIELKNARLD